MRRLFWVAVGAATAVATLRTARRVVDEHVPAGARSALGAAAGLTATVERARAELRAGTAQREAQLRADLLAGADLTRSRATVDAWRARRSGDDASDPTADPAADASGPGRERRPVARGSHRAEDPEDGPEGYSFY